MKAILAVDASVRNPKFDIKAYHKARKAGKRYAIPHALPAPEGTVINHPDAWQLIFHGMARPGDAECWERVKVEDESIDNAKIDELIQRQKDLQAGLGLDLDEDDYEELKDNE